MMCVWCNVMLIMTMVKYANGANAYLVTKLSLPAPKHPVMSVAVVHVHTHAHKHTYTHRTNRQNGTNSLYLDNHELMQKHCGKVAMIIRRPPAITVNRLVRNS